MDTASCSRRSSCPGVPAQEESRRKEYRLTQQGESVLRGELERLRELVRNGETILEQGAKE